PGGELLVPGLQNEVVAARMLDGGRKLGARSSEDGVTVALPPQAPDPIASVAILEIRGRPVVVKPAIRQAEDGSLTLSAVAADLRGPSAVSPPRLEGPAGEMNIGYWFEPRCRAEWVVEIKKPGEFAVSAIAAATGDGARITVSAAGSALEAAIPSTGDYKKYTTVELGRLDIPQPGRHAVILQPKTEGWTPINIRRLVLTPAAGSRAARPSSAKSFDLTSPDGKIEVTVTLGEAAGALTFRAESRGTPILAESPLGILTDRARFTEGLELVSTEKASIDETYTLPHGKVSTYHNRANELTLSLEKEGQRLDVIFRAYDDGIAFRYAIPGAGGIRITEEATAFHVAGAPVYWGQSHPNAYGYEFPLGRIDSESLSLALLCELEEEKHWVLLAQAATYGDYCIPHLARADGNRNLLKLAFPLDQKEPIRTALPFASPWRVAVISPDDPGAIVEQTLFENLNPPTEPELLGADWIRPGRASWDWFAGDKPNWKGWVEFAAEMGWEYHLIDAGWEGYVKDPAAATEYARSKGRGIFAWRKTPGLMEPEAIEELFEQYSEIGFRGSKVDFFDRLPGGKTGDDYEDTQMGLRVRDNLCRIGAKHRIQLVFHGCAIPSGERRRWPHVLGTEAIKGQEGSPSAESDNCIAYIRNPLGSVDWSPVWFGKGGKTDAYQLATSVVFETGLLIFADLHRDYLAHPSRDFLRRVPAAWDETRFISGYPGSHTVIARRKGKEWYVGGLATKRRDVELPLEFLEGGRAYTATVYRDTMTGLEMAIETRQVSSADTMTLPVVDRGGFVIHLAPARQ
ncbi:MAG: glycoside hydrolase family 97 N-terminal domain-containing protein, partial [Planctomycetes bacterium]|nr:glycoside hydrolase family 97 N-terminal domain-containing protein [Planctomycetota bacterium]